MGVSEGPVESGKPEKITKSIKRGIAQAKSFMVCQAALIKGGSSPLLETGRWDPIFRC